MFQKKEIYSTTKSRQMTNKSIHIISYLLLICVLCFPSCSNSNSISPELHQAEMLMETAPDSALTILNNIQSPEKLSSKEYAAYSLLFTQALDKNYIMITSDSLIKKAVAYYENQNDIPALALSYYYMGRAYSDMQDALQAQQSYLKARELGESLHATDLLIKANNSLGTLYSYQDIYEMALPLYKRTLQLLENSNDSTRISFALRNTARVFTETQEPDSAIYYYRQAIKRATPQSISSLYNDLGSLYLKTKQYQDAYDCIQKSMQTCLPSKPRYHLYLTYGEYLLKTAQYDSARYYLNRSLESPSIYTQAGSLYFLARIERQKSNLTNYFKYWDRYEQLRDSIDEDSHYENIRVVQSMFNYQRIADEKSKYEKEASQRMIIIYQILIITATLFLVGFFIFKKEQKKKKKLLDLKEQLYKQSQQYIEDNKKQIRLLERNLSEGEESLSEVKKQLFETQKLILEMENRQVSLKQNTVELLEQDFKRSSLYSKIHKADSGLTDSEWSELVLLIDATYSNFTSRILELSPRLSPEELRICYLVKIGVPVKKIAILTNITSSGVSQCRRRLYKKLTQESENAEKFDSFISDF